MRINEIANLGFFYNDEQAIKALEAGELVRYIKGDLNLRGISDIELPDNLKVTGLLSIDKLTHIPSNLKVGSLFIINSKLTSLPDNISIANSLEIHQTPLKTLPANLTVPGNLKMSFVDLKELPRVNVGGDISIHNSRIEKLPNGLKVDGDLDIEGNTIKHLPDDLVVKGDLNLLNTWVDTIPKTVQIGGTITR